MALPRRAEDRGEGEGRAMYGQVSVGACGFWSDGTLVPFAKDTR